MKAQQYRKAAGRLPIRGKCANVQRACYGVPTHDAVCKGAASMRASIFNSEEGFPGIEDR